LLHLGLYYFYTSITTVSSNVSAFTNPHRLKLPVDQAQRSVRRVEDLASAELSARTYIPENTSCGPRRECGVRWCPRLLM